jgi:hypothetical protein
MHSKKLLSWQILIGEMDQANGASATVAQWLSVLADNLDIVEVLLNDIGSGFVWFGDQLKKIDPQTIEALKTALLSAYDAIKSLGSTIGTVFETTGDVLNTLWGKYLILIVELILHLIKPMVLLKHFKL